MVPTPVVFVRVANKGVRGYGKWKSAQAYVNKGPILARMQMDLPFVVPENHPGRKRRVALLRMTILGRMVRRVRKRMKTKEGFFGERAGINTESAEVAENTEEAQGRAGPPRRAGARN